MKRYCTFALAVAATMSGPALAQEAITLSAQDDGTHTPQLREVPGANNVTNYYVIGDDAFGDVFAQMATLRQIPEAENRRVADDLWDRRDTNAPIFLMEAARRYVTIDPERAVEAFLLGRARIVYDALRCSDSTAIQAIPLVNEFAGDAVTQLLSDWSRTHRHLTAIYSSGDIFTSQASPWWICSSTDSVFYAAVNNQPITRNEWLKQAVDWPAVRDAVNRNMVTNINVAEAQAEGQ
tara:strand:+ start:2265 stop:2975 length:711 start_codon:yes stop_codon:yes gene_type:complete